MTLQTIRRRLNKLKRFAPALEYDYPVCGCCESSAYSSMEHDVKGEYVRFEDVQQILKEKS